MIVQVQIKQGKSEGYHSVPSDSLRDLAQMSKTISRGRLQADQRNLPDRR